MALRGPNIRWPDLGFSAKTSHMFCGVEPPEDLGRHGTSKNLGADMRNAFSQRHFSRPVSRGNAIFPAAAGLRDGPRQYPERGRGAQGAAGGLQVRARGERVQRRDGAHAPASPGATQPTSGTVDEGPPHEHRTWLVQEGGPIELLPGR